MRQQLLHQTDERTMRWSRPAFFLFLLVFVGWLAYFGAAAPWNAGDESVGVGEFFARFFGIALMIALVLSPLAIAAIAERRRPR